jgi:hypothetical protein
MIVVRRVRVDDDDSLLVQLFCQDEHEQQAPHCEFRVSQLRDPELFIFVATHSIIPGAKRSELQIPEHGTKP